MPTPTKDFYLNRRAREMLKIETLLKQGYSQGKIAKIIGVAPQTVSYWINKDEKDETTFREEALELYDYIVLYKMHHNGNSPSVRTMMRLNKRSRHYIYKLVGFLRELKKIETETISKTLLIHVLGSEFLPPEGWIPSQTFEFGDLCGCGAKPVYIATGKMKPWLKNGREKEVKWYLCENCLIPQEIEGFHVEKIQVR